MHAPETHTHVLVNISVTPAVGAQRSVCSTVSGHRDRAPASTCAVAGVTAAPSRSSTANPAAAATLRAPVAPIMFDEARSSQPERLWGSTKRADVKPPASAQVRTCKLKDLTINIMKITAVAVAQREQCTCRCVRLRLVAVITEPGRSTCGPTTARSVWVTRTRCQYGHPDSMRASHAGRPRRSAIVSDLSGRVSRASCLAPAGVN